MKRAMRWLDAAGAWGLVLIGCLHNFVSAPMRFDGVSDDLFWFLSAGLALWYAGAANLVRQAGALRAAILASVPVNLTLLALIFAQGLHSGQLAGAGGILLVSLAVIETLFSLVQAFSPASARTQSA